MTYEASGRIEKSIFLIVSIQPANRLQGNARSGAQSQRLGRPQAHESVEVATLLCVGVPRRKTESRASSVAVDALVGCRRSIVLQGVPLWARTSSHRINAFDGRWPRTSRPLSASARSRSRHNRIAAQGDVIQQRVQVQADQLVRSSRSGTTRLLKELSFLLAPRRGIDPFTKEPMEFVANLARKRLRRLLKVAEGAGGVTWEPAALGLALETAANRQRFAI